MAEISTGGGRLLGGGNGASLRDDETKAFVAAILRGDGDRVKQFIRRGIKSTITAKASKVIPGPVRKEMKKWIPIELKAELEPDFRMLPIHMASKFGHFDAVKALILQLGEDIIDSKDDAGNYAVHWAAGGDDVGLLEFFISHGLSANLRTEDWRYRTPLHFAAKEGAYETTKFLLRLGADPTAKSSQEDLEVLPIHLAARGRTTTRPSRQCKFAKVVDIFMKTNPALSRAADLNGNLPIHYAARNGMTDIVDCLMQHKADGEARNGNGESALFLACYYQQEDCATYMRTKYKANVHARCCDNGKTPFHVVAINGNLPILRLFLQLGANVGLRCYDGSTALHLAAEQGHIEAVQALIQWKSKPHASDSFGDLALHRAAKNGKVDVFVYYNTIADFSIYFMENKNGKNAMELFEASGYSPTPQVQVIKNRMEAQKQKMMARLRGQQPREPGSYESWYKDYADLFNYYYSSPAKK